MRASINEEVVVWLRNWEHWAKRKVTGVALAAETMEGVQQWEPKWETHWREWHERPATI